jgi:hypothetical protein
VTEAEYQRLRVDKIMRDRRGRHRGFLTITERREPPWLPGAPKLEESDPDLVCDWLRSHRVRVRHDGAAIPIPTGSERESGGSGR